MTRAFTTVAVTILLIAGCQTTPETPSGRDELNNSSEAVVKRFQAEDPSLRDVMHRAYGYAVFPKAGKGGFIVSGGYGRGVVYEQARLIGYADITQASVGATVGGQSFEELIVFESRESLERFKNNQLAFAANASAVAIESGKAASARYENGVMVFLEPKKGAMLDASVGGQKFTFVPLDRATATTRPASAGEKI